MHAIVQCAIPLKTGTQLSNYINSITLYRCHFVSSLHTCPGRLNWWTRTGTLPSLEPLATSGDGNCLLHAASLYMWGFHDRELILRTALHRTLTTGVEKQGIQRRWKYHTQLRNDDIDLTFSADEWDFEWRDVVRIATNQPRQQRVTASLKRYSSIRLSYESLEEIHVFALAHVLRRAVIVISDCTVKNFSGEDLAPIYFGGIYLPFEVNPTSCYKSPIVLGYDSSHFAPLVAKDDKKIEEQRQRARFARVSGRKDTVVPLVTPDGSLLPVQFVYDPEKKLVQKKWATSEFTPGEFPDEIVRLLEAYLDVRWIQLKVESVMTSVERSRSMTENDTDQDYDHLLPIEVTKVRFPAAYIKQEPPPIYQKELIDKYLDNVRTRYEEQLAFKAKREEEKKKREENQPVPCATEGCGMFGKLATNNLCSVCYQAAQVTKNDVNEYITQSQENESQFIITKPSEDKSRQASTEYQWPVSDSPDSHRPIPKQVGPSLSKESTSRPLVNRTTPPPALPPRGQPSPSKSSYSKAVTETRGQPSPSKSTYSKAVTETIPKDTITSGEAKMNNRRRSPSPSSPAKTLPAPASPSKSTPSSKPDGSKQSWAKKLKIPTFKNASPLGPKKTTSGGGYSRDQIKPILVDSSGSINTAGGTARVQCKNTGCEFYGSKDKNGHCSKCYNELSKDSNV